MSFKKNKYQVIRGAISKEIAEIAYKYLQISAEADHWMLENGLTHAGNKLLGNFKDQQVYYLHELHHCLTSNDLPLLIFVNICKLYLLPLLIWHHE